jgi:predicted transcriptional regulator
LEASVLEALLARDVAMTAGQVQEVVGGGLAYTTVMTILSRLYEKGAVDRRRVGRAYAYRPVSDEPGLAARRMRRVLDAEPDRDTVLARFVDDLAPSDEALLRRLLES